MTTPGQQQRAGIVPYDTRINPLAPPSVGIFDEPTRPVCVNVEWIPHIDGLLERLVWEDAWLGDDVTIDFAIAQVRKLMIALALGNSCGSMTQQLQVRQNGTSSCILESSIDGGQTWIQFADLSTCVGLPGPQGEQGPIGPQGIQGEQGPAGVDGQDGTNGNNLPDPPTRTESPDKVCSAAHGIADRVLIIVTDIITDLSVLTNLEILEALLVSPFGWNGSVLQQLIASLETADPTTIANEYNAEKTNLIEQLYCGDLDKDIAKTWAEQVVSWSVTTRQIIGQAIDAITDGQWALWAFVDGEKGLGDCSTFSCVTTQTCWDFVNGQQGWSESASLGEWIGSRFRMRTNQQYTNGCFRFVMVIPTGLNLNNVVGVSVDWDSSAGNSRNNNINDNFVRYIYTDGTVVEIDMPDFDLPSGGFVGTLSYDLPASDPTKTVDQIVFIHTEWVQPSPANSTGTMYVDGICLETL